MRPWPIRLGDASSPAPGGSATVSALEQGFGLTQPTISWPLKLLERAGLISRSRVARPRPCRLEPEGLHALGARVGDLRSIYEDNYARLDDVLERLQVESKDPTP